MIEYFQEVVAKVIERQAEAYEAPWLRNFNLRFREFEVEDKLFQTAPFAELPPNFSRDVFNVQHPLALQVFEGSFVRQVAGGEFENFARGAALVSILFGAARSSMAMDFIRAQLEAMDERIYNGLNPYPQLDQSFASLYSSCVSLILLGEETTNWRPMLNFVVGALWLFGFRQDDCYQSEMVDIVLYYTRTGSFNA